MSVLQYLPSTQFSTIVSSIALSGGLILGAQYVTRAPDLPSAVVSDQIPSADDDWKLALEAIQATAPGIPEPPSEDSVATLLEAAKSSNITSTVARSLFISLTDASSQGLGSDIPTQERLISQAVSQLPPTPPKQTYSLADLKISGTSAADERRYGNQVIEALGRHTGATSAATLLAVSKATDNTSAAELQVLLSIQDEYAALAQDLLGIPVPKTLSPLHLQIVNDLTAIAATFDDLKEVLDDPLRGLQGLQAYQSLLGETGRVFTSVAEALSKDGILFSKGEPGEAWGVFLSASTP